MGNCCVVSRGLIVIKIDFKFDTAYGIFSDALYFQDNQIPSEAEIESIKISRRDAWINLIENPPIDTEADYPPLEYLPEENLE